MDLERNALPTLFTHYLHSHEAMNATEMGVWMNMGVYASVMGRGSPLCLQTVSALGLK